MTNYEKLRALSLEELVNWIDGLDLCVGNLAACADAANCADCWTRWLESQDTSSTHRVRPSKERRGASKEGKCDG